MDYETVSPEQFGRSLRGLGLNLLVRDVPGLAGFLADVFGAENHRVNRDFAIITWPAHGAENGPVLLLHHDATYAANPLHGLLPEAGPRGAGAQVHLYGCDPDAAVAATRAHRHGATILAEPQDKPHGLREAVILCENGYAWVPSRPLPG